MYGGTGFGGGGGYSAPYGAGYGGYSANYGAPRPNYGHMPNAYNVAMPASFRQPSAVYGLQQQQQQQQQQQAYQYQQLQQRQQLLQEQQRQHALRQQQIRNSANALLGSIPSSRPTASLSAMSPSNAFSHRLPDIGASGGAVPPPLFGASSGSSGAEAGSMGSAHGGGGAYGGRDVGLGGLPSAVPGSKLLGSSAAPSALSQHTMQLRKFNIQKKKAVLSLQRQQMANAMRLALAKRGAHPVIHAHQYPGGGGDGAMGNAMNQQRQRQQQQQDRALEREDSFAESAKAEQERLEAERLEKERRKKAKLRKAKKAEKKARACIAVHVALSCPFCISSGHCQSSSSFFFSSCFLISNQKKMPRKGDTKNWLADFLKQEGIEKLADEMPGTDAQHIANKSKFVLAVVLCLSVDAATVV